eukprot:CAMPEP_0197921104 /NCGR_PEP_ID=MMETSP1439-20131203/90055_1 /TAXON_ID=66791 /ORGANISM="Gonyaulax spinifera, Strain CCMP409" /LENGTH=129 /DNA_ID=CAMNT_0043543339 /DNA_START=57 /DNA_END=443 /DNA_ORIENTATION=+
MAALQLFGGRNLALGGCIGQSAFHTLRSRTLGAAVPAAAERRAAPRSTTPTFERVVAPAPASRRATGTGSPASMAVGDGAAAAARVLLGVCRCSRTRSTGRAQLRQGLPGGSFWRPIVVGANRGSGTHD